MTPRCNDPELQMDMLTELRNADALPPDQSEHLEQCEACQIAAERQRRIVSVWETGQAAERDVAVAVAHFHARREENAGPGWIDVIPFAAAGIVAGCVLLATTHSIHAPVSSRALTVPSLTESTGLGHDPAPTQTTSPAPTEPAPRPVKAESPKEDVPAPIPVPAPPSSAVPKVTPDRGAAAAPPADDASSAIGRVKLWAQATDALHQDDFAAADRAFETLAHAPDPATRDAARLGRAELWFTHGREQAARPVLEQLAQTGATPVIRRKAAELLIR